MQGGGLSNSKEFIFDKVRETVPKLMSTLGREILVTSVELINMAEVPLPIGITDNFHYNRKLLVGVIDGASKRDLNLITGYTTRYVIKKRNRAAKDKKDNG